MKPGNHDYVLWLPSWYPNKLSPFDGDFIQRQAQAASSFVSIHVLYFVRDSKNAVTHSVHIEENHRGNLSETIVYYSAPKFSIKMLDEFFSLPRFMSIFKKITRGFFTDHATPVLVHVHVAFKAGMIARWIERKFKIPFILSEHWTIYLDEATPKFSNLSFAKKYLISSTIRGALNILAVSEQLGKAIQRKWPSVTYRVIPNVVNTDIFYPAQRNDAADRRCHLVHASNLNYQKAPETLFRAMKILKNKGIEFVLDVFGAGSDYIKSLTETEGIAHLVRFHGEVSQPLLAESIRNSRALILYSRYETFGCVIIEANACGVPVIVSDLPVFHETVQENRNGIFAGTQDANLLAERIFDLINGRPRFDKNAMVNMTVLKYSYPVVGKELKDYYDEVLKNQQLQLKAASRK